MNYPMWVIVGGGDVFVGVLVLWVVVYMYKKTQKINGNAPRRLQGGHSDRRRTSSAASAAIAPVDVVAVS